MISAEVSLRKKEERKRQETGHDAIGSNSNLSVVPKDAFSTETSTAALAMLPKHRAKPSVDSGMRQSPVENAAKEKNLPENPSDGSQAMTGTEVSMRKREKKKKTRETRRDGIGSNGNISVVSKDTLLTQTSTASFIMPNQHPDQPSVDWVTRQSQVENAAEEKNMLKNVSDGSPTMTTVEVSLRKKDKGKKRQKTRHNVIESNGNLSAIPNNAFSTETSTAALAMPPQHFAQPSVDSVMRQSQVEDAAKEKNMLENASDGSQIMTSAEASLRKREKTKKIRETRHDVIESNGNISVVPNDTLLTQTSAAAFIMPPQHPAQPSVDPAMRQSREENAAKEKNMLENVSDGSPTMTSVEVSLRKKDKEKKRRKTRHNAIESNGNLSAIPNNAFSTETSTAALAMPPQHFAQPSVDSVMRQSHVEDAAKEKNMLENASDGSQIMTSAEVSLRKREKTKKIRETRHDVIESNGNISVVPNDTLLTQTSAAAFIMPPQHPAQPSVDPAMRQSWEENAAKEKNMLENVSDGSPTMTSVEVSLRKKDEGKKRWKTRHNAIESNGNLSAIPNKAFSAETSTAALAMPPQHLAQPSVDSVMRQSHVEDAAKEKNMLENASDGSQIMTSAEVSLRKREKTKKIRETRHDGIESNGNLSDVPKDAFLTETSTAALAMPPTHPAEHSVDPVMRHFQVENASDGSLAMTNAEVILRKKDKRKRRGESRTNDVEINGRLSDIPKDTFSIETSTAAMVTPPAHPAQHSLDPVMRQSQVENAGKENHVLQDSTDGYLAMTNVDVNSRKKDKKGKRKKARHNNNEINVIPFGVPKDNFSLETSITTLDLSPQHSDQCFMDPVMGQSQEANVEEVQNMIEKPAYGPSAMTTEEVNPRKKNRKRKKRKTGYKCDINLSEVPKDTFSPETCIPNVDMRSQYPAPYSMDQVMNQYQEKNEEKEQNMVKKATNGSPAMTSAEMNSRKKKKRRKRKKTRHDSLQSDVNLSRVSKDTISFETSVPLFMLSPQPSQFLSMELAMGQPLEEYEGKEQNTLDQGSEIKNSELNLEIKYSNPGPVVANSRPFENEFVKLDTVRGDIADLSLVNKQDDCSEVSHYSLGRTISSFSKKKLLVLDLNGLLADFVLGVPEGYKPDRKIHNKAVFKRPFCDDFLQFCFDKFHVGIWSSRKRQNVDAAIKLLVGNSAFKLLFTWNQSHCTKTKFQTVEDKNKPLMLKELRKLWDKCRPVLPWKKGEFNESNTLLLDDSPYKALRNPMHTAIFPYSYQYSDTNDTSLGPGGDLRVYLEGLAMAENVQEYVASHPFGQPAITELDPHWYFYRLVRDKDLNQIKETEQDEEIRST